MNNTKKHTLKSDEKDASRKKFVNKLKPVFECRERKKIPACPSTIYKFSLPKPPPNLSSYRNSKCTPKAGNPKHELVSMKRVACVY
jgi:hypothetical protein